MYNKSKRNPHRIQARKRFGQHFLVEPDVIDKIINCINPKAGEALLEIGPGRGALTKPILRLTKKLKAIEIDQDLVNYLQDSCRLLGELQIYQADVLDFDLHTAITPGQKLRIFGNLPYNISTPLLFYLIKNNKHIQDMYFMLQQEVARRLSAQPGSRTYGRLSVIMQYYCHTATLFEVSASAFSPRPKVHSAFVQIMPREKRVMHANDEDMFYRVVKEAFGKRRKTLQNALKQLLTKEQLEKSGINPLQRAETLSVEDYIKLSNSIVK